MAMNNDAEMNTTRELPLFTFDKNGTVFRVDSHRVVIDLCKPVILELERFQLLTQDRGTELTVDALLNLPQTSTTQYTTRNIIVVESQWGYLWGCRIQVVPSADAAKAAGLPEGAAIGGRFFWPWSAHRAQQAYFKIAEQCRLDGKTRMLTSFSPQLTALTGDPRELLCAEATRLSDAELSVEDRVFLASINIAPSILASRFVNDVYSKLRVEENEQKQELMPIRRWLCVPTRREEGKLTRSKLFGCNAMGKSHIRLVAEAKRSKNLETSLEALSPDLLELVLHKAAVAAMADKSHGSRINVLSSMQLVSKTFLQLTNAAVHSTMVEAARAANDFIIHVNPYRTPERPRDVRRETWRTVALPVTPHIIGYKHPTERGAAAQFVRTSKSLDTGAQVQESRRDFSRHIDEEGVKRDLTALLESWTSINAKVVAPPIAG